MILIKALSFILLFPSFFVVKKVIRKEDLNFFDLLVLFSTLFFVVIPLKSDEKVFNAIGILTTETSIYVFFYLLFFLIGSLIASSLIVPDNNSPINITYFIKKYPKIKISVFFKVLLILLPVVSLVYYIPQTSFITAFDTIQNESSKATYEQSSLIKFFSTIFRFGVIIPILLLCQNLKNKKIDILLLISLSLFLINFLMLSRRDLLEFFLFGFVVFYSINRQVINRKFISYSLIFGALIYFIYFPFYNVIRTTSVEFKIEEPFTSVQKIYEYGIDNYSKTSNSASDLTDTRAINLYRAIYWIARNDSDRDITWGGITLSAIDHAIPKFINPGKGLGSEIVLQDRQHISYDSADSFLLLALADYSTLGALITIFFYLFIYKLWKFITAVNKFIFGNSIVALYVVYSLFSLSFSIETKLDAILADTVAFLIMVVIIDVIHSTNFITIKSNKVTNREYFKSSELQGVE
ncbi:hypothetical protein D1013_04300 [Euzebyella marina]|uniref:Oligosaccharide repeat unit polymerase n=1 Tax=Euzebyella marina TaxID=1761453 RepID=A0A3G2L304_9FLAO|nr:O-antigen polymerase [Euzebyella marina]AYN66657.1 hypothetical protein D1013_04300 [Euzebyella marina]